MHIKAGYLSGYPIRCCICRDVKDAGRVYDVDDVGIPDPMTGDTFKASGPVSICQACRDEFHGADMELEAAELERRPPAPEPSDWKETVQYAEEHGWSDWAKPATHMTFPPDKG